MSTYFFLENFAARRAGGKSRGGEPGALRMVPTALRRMPAGWRVRGCGWGVGSPLIGRTEQRLDIDDRRSIDRFQGRDPEPRTGDLQDRDPVEPDRVGAIGGARREHTLQRYIDPPARVHPKHVAARVVQPGEHYELVSHGDAGESRSDRGGELQPGLGSALVSLARCLLEPGQARAYDAHRLERIAAIRHASHLLAGRSIVEPRPLTGDRTHFTLLDTRQ